ncbi:hypothetical protein GZH49_37395 [Nocardia terpenica]|uniref:hypothetical protein n=1 Tax=Nocardia terpenica TaxID=455432 RepID=UPI002FDFEDB6
MSKKKRRGISKLLGKVTKDVKRSSDSLLDATSDVERGARRISRRAGKKKW